jgi:protein-L-isoaspartate(D-aspartate) O-methyltransferase
MNNEIARANMIEQQIRPWNVLEMQTLTALNQVRREDFVPAEYQHLAFADVQVPMGNGEVMLEPKVGARLVEALDLDQDCRVLEIGTGTGYLTALMASICSHVTSVEIDGALVEQARRNLAMAAISNVELVEADCFGYCALPDNQSTFDRVLVTGSIAELAPVFSAMISERGCVAGIQGNDPAMQAVVCTSTAKIRTLFETSVPRLKNVSEEPSFTF